MQELEEIDFLDRMRDYKESGLENGISLWRSSLSDIKDYFKDCETSLREEFKNGFTKLIMTVDYPEFKLEFELQPFFGYITSRFI
jgi:hypothetical protein